MKIVKRIKNYLFLRKLYKQPELKDINFEFMVKTGFKYYRKFRKNCYERNLLASVIKKYRGKHSYSIRGWAKNQKHYEDYFKGDNVIQSLQEVKDRLEKGDVYVTMFRDTSYYKGNGIFEYWSCGTILKEPQVYKLIDYKERYNSFRIVENGLITLDEEWMTAFKYSTEEEIEKFKAEESRQKEIKKQIKEKQKEIDNLYKQL